MSRKTAYSSFSTKATPQRVQARGDQVKNNAGGFVFQVGKWAQFDRFLILGTEGGTYYVGEQKLTAENAKNVQACIKEDGQRAVKRIVEISDSGRAPKNDPALFALALAASTEDVKTRKAALEALPQVARIGTHLFHFAQYVDNMRGWGRLLREAIANWYLDKDVQKLAYQLIKYQQRDGWSHRDLLRLAHPVAPTQAQNVLLNYAVKGLNYELYPAMDRREVLPSLVVAFEEAKTASAKRVIELIREHGLTREMIPTELLNRTDVWAALLEKMPLEAMTRNLGKMSSIGLLKPLSVEQKLVVDRLGDAEYIRKSRLHPLAILVAYKVYGQGHGMKGDLSWSVNQKVFDAMDRAFYLAFDNVEPSGKRFSLGIDTSGSMFWDSSRIAGTPVYAGEAAAVMAMVTAKKEPATWITAYSTSLQEPKFSENSRLQEVVSAIGKMSHGGTNCAVPIQYALKQQISVDCFVNLTDNETWAGGQHVYQALNEYRQKMGIPAKLVVVGMTASGFSIADPNDPGQLDVVGFDTATPGIISDFARS